MSKKPDVRINQNLIEFFDEESLNYGEKQDPTLTLTIPLYQREYAWGVEEKKLFCDTLKSDKGCEFLGTIILQRSDNPFIFEIIDGQQRLTTLLNLNSSGKDPIYGTFKVKNKKISLQRSFDKWKQGQAQEDIQTSLIETDEIIQKAKFNWIVYTKDISGEKTSSETLFQRINIDSKALSVFDEFKARYIQAEHRGNIQETKEIVPWKQIENLFVINSYKNIKFEKTSLYDILNREDLFCEYNEFDHEWLLRQFLAICYQILSTNPKDRKFYQDNKSMLNDRDPIRKEFRDIKFFTSCSNEELSKGFQIGKVISTLIQGIENNEILISRHQLKDLSTNALQEENTQNKAYNDALFLLLSFQIFAMSFQTWLSSNNYDQCFLIYKNYYRRKKALTGNLSLKDVDFISNETICELITGTNLLKSIHVIKNLESKKITDLSQKDKIIKALEKVTTTNRSDLWIADWILYSFLFKRKNNEESSSRETQLQEKLRLENAFEKAFESAFQIIDISESKENIQKTTQEILHELEDIYFSKSELKENIQKTIQKILKELDDLYVSKSESKENIQKTTQKILKELDDLYVSKSESKENIQKTTQKILKELDDLYVSKSESKENIQKTIQKILRELDDLYYSLDTLPELNFSNEIEHWHPQASKDENVNKEYLNLYGNLCLLPKSINIELSNQTTNIKAEYILKTRYSPKKLLPKIYLTALITKELEKDYKKKENSEESKAEKLICFLTIFWLIFIFESIPENYRKSLCLS